jgi:hypothetical protein
MRNFSTFVQIGFILQKMKQKVTCRVFLTGLLIIVLIHPLLSQRSYLSLKQKISCSEKWWAFKHPFIAKKAVLITKYSLAVTDSLGTNFKSDNPSHSSRLDAFKHAFWMASLVQDMKWKKARNLGLAHEKGNYRSHIKAIRHGFIEDHDKVNSEMDLWNNEKGIAIGLACKDCNPHQLMKIVIDSIQAGSMKVVKTNAEGRFLDVNGNILAEEDYKGKWINNKCLVSSN